MKLSSSNKQQKRKRKHNLKLNEELLKQKPKEHVKQKLEQRLFMYQHLDLLQNQKISMKMNQFGLLLDKLNQV